MFMYGLVLIKLYKKKKGRMFIMKKIVFLLAFIISFSMINPVGVSANKAKYYKTGITHSVTTVGWYGNWDGVSDVSQFTDSDGHYCFAYDNDSKVVIVKTKKGKVTETIEIKKEHTEFGAVDCDSDGNFYIVTGESNSNSNTSTETVFISKYSPEGKLIKTVGNNGSSSLAYYYDDSFYTKNPFDAGNCDIAVNGDYVAVNYGRGMYSGHQSNSVWIVKRDNLETVKPNTSIYNSHSFGQRAIPFETGFLFMSEGDCYPRAFTMNYESMAHVDGSGSSSSVISAEADIFHFWVKKGTLDAWDMYTLNNNFATIGDICDLGNGNASFVAMSVKSMTSKATDQIQNIFIQIFNPKKNLDSASGYTTSGKRSGQSGPNGDKKTTDYGVKWITNFSASSGKKAVNAQAVADDDGNTIILFEYYKNNSYKGVYYCVVNSEGEITTSITKCSSVAKLNRCETPVWADGKVWWTANSTKSNKLYIYSLEP